MGLLRRESGPAIEFLNRDFRQRLAMSRYAYTCGSGLDMPIRKFFEIPAGGTVLACRPFTGFADAGFVDGVNAVVCEPQDIMDVHRTLVADPARAQRIADSGRRLVAQYHSTAARAEQLRRLFEMVAAGRFAGAGWSGGKFIVAEREVSVADLQRPLPCARHLGNLRLPVPLLVTLMIVSGLLEGLAVTVALPLLGALGSSGSQSGFVRMIEAVPAYLGLRSGPVGVGVLMLVLIGASGVTFLAQARYTAGLQVIYATQWQTRLFAASIRADLAYLGDSGEGTSSTPLSPMSIGSRAPSITPASCWLLSSTLSSISFWRCWCRRS